MLKWTVICVFSALLGAAAGAWASSRTFERDLAEARDRAEREIAASADLRRRLADAEAHGKALRVEVEALRRDLGHSRSGTGAVVPVESAPEPREATTPPPDPESPSAMEAQSRDLAKGWVEDVVQVQDPVKRAAAIAAILEALGSGDPVRVLAGLWAVENISDVRYDKASMRAAVVPLLNAEEPLVRRAALFAVMATGREAGDLELVLRLRDDPSPTVRKEMPRLVSRVAGGDLTGDAGAVVLRALDEALAAEAARPKGRQSSVEFREFLSSVYWRKPSPEIEQRLLGLARDPATRELIFHNLFVNMDKSPRVVELLIEALEDPKPLIRMSALRSLTYQVPDSLAPQVAAALGRILEARSSDSGIWHWSLRGLREYGTASEVPLLERLVANEMIPEYLRKWAAETLERIRERLAQ